MAETKKLSHFGPNLTKVSHRAKKINYAYRSIAENIAYGQTTAQGVVDAWVKSPPHAKNILTGEFRWMGIGAAKGKNGLIYWTQVLAVNERDGVEELLRNYKPHNMLVVVNKERKKHGLKPVKMVVGLNATAQDMALKMAATNSLSPAGLLTMGERARKHKVAWKKIAENVVAGSRDEQGAMDVWLKYPNNARHVVDVEMNAMGVGMAVNESGKVYWALCLAKV
jgi:uncharacterized protein YkwD